MKIRAPLWLWICAWWFAYALMYATQIVRMRDEAGRLITWSRALGYSFIGWMVWIPFTLAALWLVRRFPISRQSRANQSRAMQSWAKPAACYLLSIVAAIVFKAVLVYASNPWLAWYPTPDIDLVPLLEDSARNNFIVAALVIGVAHAFLYAERAHQHALQIAQLQASLTLAKLDALSAKLNPHFLFNALNSVAELLHHDVKAADQMLVALSTLLRRSLSNAPEHTHSLAAELALLQHYLAIESMRLGPRLQLEMQIDDVAKPTSVPVFALQALCENAIVHGIAKRAEGGVLRIVASQTGAFLRVSVQNPIANGAPASPGNGVSLQQLRERLQCLYHSDEALQISENADHFCAELRLPC
jgi:hypothetical protein